MFKKILISLFIILLIVFSATAFVIHKLTDRVEGSYFDSKGVNIHYTISGSGPPLILVHGFASHADMQWRHTGVIDALDDHFTVITFDNRGVGLSDKPHDAEAYGIEMCNDVIRLMDHLAIEQCYLGGYSLGGFITLKTASLYPDRFLGIAVMGAGWEDPDNDLALVRLQECVEQLKQGKGIDPPGSILDDERPKAGLIHTIVVRTLTRYFSDPVALAGILEAGPELAITKEELQMIDMPVLSIIGTDDPMVGGVDRLEGQLEDHEVIRLEGKDHVHAARDPRLLEELEAFLLELEAASTME